MTGIKIRTEARFDIRSLSLVFYLIFFLFFYQLLLSASCFLSVSCSLSDLIADALEVVYAGLDVAQGSLLVPGVALLLDGDVSRAPVPTGHMVPLPQPSKKRMCSLMTCS